MSTRITHYVMLGVKLPEKIYDEKGYYEKYEHYINNENQEYEN